VGPSLGLHVGPRLGLHVGPRLGLHVGAYKFVFLFWFESEADLRFLLQSRYTNLVHYRYLNCNKLNKLPEVGEYLGLLESAI